MNVYRPCLVDKRKALFHQWVNEEIPILKINAVCTDRIVKAQKERFAKNHICANGSDIEKVRRTLGIVEFEDGTVKLVEPTEITFLNTKEFLKG